MPLKLLNEINCLLIKTYDWNYEYHTEQEFKYCNDCISMKPYKKNEYPYGRRTLDNMFNL